MLKQGREWQHGLKATMSHWYYFGSGSCVGPLPFSVSATIDRSQFLFLRAFSALP